MSQETQIGNLKSEINDEDSKLVDSILNDLNSHSAGNTNVNMQPPQNNPQPEQKQDLTPEQIRQIQMQRQMAMQQQQLMQQQMMQQQMAQQQMRSENKLPNGETDRRNEMNLNSDTFIDQIKNQSKTVILVIFLSIIFNLEQIDAIFKTQANLFVSESGGLNIQAVFIKSILIGAVFYGVKTYLL